MRTIRLTFNIAFTNSLLPSLLNLQHGLPEVRPVDLAEIRYAAPSGVPPTGEAILHRDLANALRATPDRAADADGPPPTGRVALTA